MAEFVEERSGAVDEALAMVRREWPMYTFRKVRLSSKGTP